MTTAFAAFERSMQRARNLLEVHRRFPAKIDPPLHEEALDDALRSAIVLAVSAMDGYFHDRFMEALNPHLKKNGTSSELANYLQNCGVNTEFLLSVMWKGKPGAHVRRKVEERLYRVPLHDAQEAEKLFSKLGVVDLLQTLAQRSEVPKAELTGRLKKWVERRHQIAHSGDLHRGKKKRFVSRRINRGEVERCIKEIQGFVESAEKYITEILSPTRRRRATSQVQ